MAGRTGDVTEKSLKGSPASLSPGMDSDGPAAMSAPAKNKNKDTPKTQNQKNSLLLIIFTACHSARME